MRGGPAWRNFTDPPPFTFRVIEFSYKYTEETYDETTDSKEEFTFAMRVSMRGSDLEYLRPGVRWTGDFLTEVLG